MGFDGARRRRSRVAKRLPAACVQPRRAETDVTRGVAGRFDDLRIDGAEFDPVAIAHGLVDFRDAAGFRLGRDYAAMVALLQFLDAAGMVGVTARGWPV